MKNNHLHKKKKKIKRSLIAVILTIAGITAILCFKLYPFDSQTKIDYFKHTHTILLNDRLQGDYRAKMLDQKIYVPFSFIKQKIDSHIIYDKASQAVVVTTPQQLYQLPANKRYYYKNRKKSPLNFPAFKEINGNLLISTAWLEDVYSLKVNYKSNTGALFVYRDGYEQEKAVLKKEVTTPWKRLRQRSTVTSPYYINLKAGDKVFVIDQNGSYFKVRTDSGYGGYISRKVLTKKGVTTINVKTAGINHPKLKRPASPFHLVWDGIYVKGANPAKLANLPGVSVYSPTWFTLQNSKGDIGNIASKSYVQQAHDHNGLVWALFSNAFDPDLSAKVLPSFSKRQKMISQLLHFATRYKLDGINLDFENVYEENGADFTQFVRELTPLAHQAGLTVSLNVTFQSTSGQWSKFYNRKELAKAADYVMVMSYDEHWANSQEAGSVAGLSWVESNLQRLLDEVPSSKLLLGVPLYTRLWIEDPNKTDEPKMSSTSMSMDEARSWVEKHHLTPKIDQDSGQHYVETTSNGKIYRMWLEDETSLHKRISLVDKYHLAGLASWSKRFGSHNIWEKIKTDLRN
ncbi:glycosyl hydrolase family 18 protein [Halobacillus rhizosphaerae]|uniref:glycosyl hydrolase family 18 protein n=1 Tax=Halobacillus rhizosphaerae TaxID=3064889 RepID=UPI00398B210A